MQDEISDCCKCLRRRVWPCEWDMAFWIAYMSLGETRDVRLEIDVSAKTVIDQWADTQCSSTPRVPMNTQSHRQLIEGSEPWERQAVWWRNAFDGISTLRTRLCRSNSGFVAGSDHSLSVDRVFKYVIYFLIHTWQANDHLPFSGHSAPWPVQNVVVLAASINECWPLCCQTFSARRHHPCN